MRVICTILLVVFPGLAHAADMRGMSLSGDARMGLVWSQPDPRLGGRQDGLRLTSRARLRVQFLGETDGGTRFGAVVDLDPDTRRPTSHQVHIGR